MDTLKLQSLRDVSTTKVWLWTWLIVSALSAGTLMGLYIGPGFHIGAFVGGFIGALFANIPVWVVFDMLRRIVHNQQEIYFANIKHNGSS